VGQGGGPPTAWVRRAISLSALAIAATVLVGGAPLWFGVALVIDALRPRRLAVTRALGFISVFVLCEAWGVLASGALWAWGLTGPPRDRWLAAHVIVQRRWAQALSRALVSIVGLRIEVEGPVPSAGPCLVFVRHVSMADTALPMLVSAIPHRLSPRYVLKHELLWDPCLDIVGNRLPNAFVDRQAGDGSSLGPVGALATDLGANEMVVLFPEGTRYTARRRDALIARWAARGDEAGVARARALLHTLPPRPGGALALLRRAPPETEVWVLGHLGFEGATRMTDLFSGRLVGAQVAVRAWRTRLSELPEDDAGRAKWLDQAWSRLDAWVGGLRGTAPT
jgi:1-acyl-sn-glycerol-3-phosphate acyltransferase